MTYGQLPSPRPGRDLPNGRGHVKARQPMLICSAGCDGEYSANPGDYWLTPKTEVITCGECGEPMRLVDKVTEYRPAAVGAMATLADGRDPRDA